MIVEEAEHALQNARNLRSGHLRVSTGHTIAEFIAPILIRFKFTYPGVKVSVMNVNLMVRLRPGNLTTL